MLFFKKFSGNTWRFPKPTGVGTLRIRSRRDTQGPHGGQPPLRCPPRSHSGAAGAAPGSSSAAARAPYMVKAAPSWRSCRVGGPQELRPAGSSHAHHRRRSRLGGAQRWGPRLGAAGWSPGRTGSRTPLSLQLYAARASAKIPGEHAPCPRLLGPLVSPASPFTPQAGGHRAASPRALQSSLPRDQHIPGGILLSPLPSPAPPSASGTGSPTTADCKPTRCTAVEIATALPRPPPGRPTVT